MFREQRRYPHGLTFEDFFGRTFQKIMNFSVIWEWKCGIGWHNDRWKKSWYPFQKMFPFCAKITLWILKIFWHFYVGGHPQKFISGVLSMWNLFFLFAFFIFLIEKYHKLIGHQLEIFTARCDWFIFRWLHTAHKSKKKTKNLNINDRHTKITLIMDLIIERYGHMVADQKKKRFLTAHTL